MTGLSRCRSIVPLISVWKAGGTAIPKVGTPSIRLDTAARDEAETGQSPETAHLSADLVMSFIEELLCLDSKSGKPSRSYKGGIQRTWNPFRNCF